MRGAIRGPWMGPSDALQTHCRCSPDATCIHRSSEMQSGSNPSVVGDGSSGGRTRQRASAAISRHQSPSEGVLDKWHHHREERAVAVHVIVLPLVPEEGRNHCQSVSIRVNPCQSVSIRVNQCQSVSISVNQCQSVSISVNQCQSVAIRGNPWQSVSISGKFVAINVIVLPLVPSHTQRAQDPVQVVDGALDRRADVDVQDRRLTTVAP